MKKADGWDRLRSGIKRSLCLMGEGDEIGEENGDEEREEQPDMDRIRRRSKSGSIAIDQLGELQVTSLLCRSQIHKGHMNRTTKQRPLPAFVYYSHPIETTRKTIFAFRNNSASLAS